MQRPDLIPPPPMLAVPPEVVGLDLSLAAAGISSRRGTRALKTPASQVVGPARLALIRDEVMAECRTAELVMIEGYSFASRVGGEKLGELGGVVRLALWEAGITYLEVPPSTLKVYGTGKGNAGKGAMLVEAVKRLGYTGSNDNEADAMWLRAMGLHGLGYPLVQLPQAHTRALEKIDWTALNAIGARA